VSDSGVIENITRPQALKVNMNIFGNNIYYILLLLFIVIWIAYINKQKLKLNINSSVAIEIIAVMMIPFIWVIVTANHSYVHVWMVHRIFSIAFFAFASLLISMTEESAKSKFKEHE
jgi:Ca2+/Na+ antiporter